MVMKYPPQIKMPVVFILFILFVRTDHIAGARSSGEENNSITSNEQEFSQETDQQRKENDPFQYQIESKADPFEPFSSQPPRPPEPVPAADALLMQNYKLVGVISAGKEQVAVVEDASGKGYYLNRSSKIGSSVVSLIENTQVKLTETYTTATDRRVTKEIIMFLKREGDK
ncbi:MAG: hypothetical protein D3906_05870 [Candidatus Electrothrix sp. AUS1_2]|nr:hypothetical protein [Candidatus Electrothrix sp. AUS1_2]